MNDQRLESTGINLTIQGELGKRIRKLRQQKGWSQTIMAARCGIHVSHLSKMERGGANATLATIVTIATRLEMTLSDLFQDIPSLSLAQEAQQYQVR
jgi:transcriptional regulator with XRE-family HTH domain